MFDRIAPARLRNATLALHLLTALAFGGCAAGAGGNLGGSGGTSSEGGAAGATGTESATTGVSVTQASSTTGFMTGAGGAEPAPAEVYGQSADTLYRVDPLTKAVTTIGVFEGCEVTGSSSGILDMAMDKDSNIYASSHVGLYLVDKADASCTKIAAGDYPNSLSFVPAGTLDPDEEALVGYVVSSATGYKNQYVRIDPKTGAITNVGGTWSETEVSSGDIVSVKDGPTYLTLKGGACSASDCLAEVNPQTGKLIKNLGTIDGYQKIFGFAYWGGASYGFTQAGTAFELKINGNALITTPITVGAGLSFWGAGSSTLAPVVPQ